MAPSEIDFYKILGLGRHATDEDIKRSFRKLARDTHPDKNPNDPTAKERFQDLQRAYDTLRDNLERSKYDEDNLYHGLDRSSTYRAPTGTRSGTAKRYTAGTQAHTPGWTNGTPRGGYDGFAQQASSSAKTKAWGGYEEWEAGSKTHSGFSYQTGGYRPSPSKPFPTEYEYEEAYAGYKPKKESAYARTNGERTHPTTSAKYGSHGSSASSSSPRPKSTPGTNPNPHSSTSARYAGAPTNATPGFNVADYIREKKAREMAAEEEKRRQGLEEQKTREREQRLRREAEEQLKRQEEQRKLREQERRRAEEAVRNPYSNINGFGGRSTPTPNGYSYGFPADASSPYTPKEKEEDLLREADEKMKAKASKLPHLTSSSRRRSRPSMKTRPEPSLSAKYNPLFSHVIPENAKEERDVREDIDVVEATPTDRAFPRAYFSKPPNDGPGYVRKDGAGVHPAPQFTFKAPVQEKSTPTESRTVRSQNMPGSFESSPSSSTKQPKSPRHQPSAETAQKSTSDKENRPKPTFNVFEFEETSQNPKVEKIFSKSPNFSFVGPNSRVGLSTSNNSPEPQGEKANSSGSGPYLRPRSQPTQTQPSFVPPPSAPPNMQQQQAAEFAGRINGEQRKDDSTFKQELYANLLRQTTFSFKPTSTSASGSTARRKRSAPTLKKKQSLPTHRMGMGMGSKEAKLNNQPKIESDTEADGPGPTAQPASNGFGYEPMDAEPTGAPKSMPIPKFPALTIPTVKLSSGPKKSSPLDMSGIGAVPPLSRSPADVGLGEFESLKDSLPFPSQASKKPPFPSRVSRLSSKAPSTTGDPFAFSIPADFLGGYPQAPLDQPFIVPKAPAVPKIPKQTSLDLYNRFYNSLGSYIEDWNKYEAEVHSLRAELTSKSMHVSTSQTLDTQDIVKYMDRVKNRDTVLDNAFTKARDRHIAALDMWVKLREGVLGLKGNEQH